MQQHRPIAVDLFSGAGGLSLGFEQAGFDIRAAVEIDPIHAAVHKFNFPYCTTIPNSIADLSGADIIAASKIRPHVIDVVFGGAPCQGFSLIGKRALNDPRNGLVREFIRIIDELHPKYFVFENVKGLTLGEHRLFLEEVIEAFREIQYETVAPWRVLNAKHYGVPQNRERLFLLGARSDLPYPGYPEPRTRSTDGGINSLGFQECPTCRDALDDLPDPECFHELLDRDEVWADSWGKPSPYAQELRCITPDAWHYGYRRTLDPSMMTSSMRTNHTPISRRRFADTPQGSVEPISRLFKLPENGVSNTLRAGTDSARGAFTSPRPIHYRYPRCVTVREMARLHGFPDWFRFHETKWHGARQVGNAVPPPLARHVASQIVAALGVRPVSPRRTIDLGDPVLLSMGMKDAARYWDVPVQIGNRDARSPFKKRRQVDIEAERLSASGEV